MSGTARAAWLDVTTEPSGDTTKIIPPPRRGPRWIDLALAAVAGSLFTIVAIALLFLGNQGAHLLPSAASPSPSASALPSLSSAPAATARASAAPTTAAPTDTPAATTAAPTVTPQPATTRPATPAPTIAPTAAPTRTP